ncbi:MAG: nucleotide pyrophosphohydrolase [Christensenellaceae bacterium]
MKKNLKELSNQIEKFNKERDWDQFHNIKDLAISLNLECSEFLECFQWKTSEETAQTNRSLMAEEIADILIYILIICKKLDIDLIEEAYKKLYQNSKKYPVQKAYGNNKKYTEL